MGCCYHLGQAVMGTGQKRVLVVDDDHECRLLISSIMGRAGFVVDAVADGDMALSMLRKNRPDLVLLDANLPQRDGFDVCREIKSDPDLAMTPVVMLSGFSADGAQKVSLEAGADEYMEKPFRRERLLEIARHLLAVRAQLDPGARAVAAVVADHGKR